jgi:hypothetical protein
MGTNGETAGTTPAGIAKAAGFVEWETGGGLLALRKDGSFKYWLITDDDSGIDGDPEAAVWSVGCYGNDEEDAESPFRWVYVKEEVTLAQALEAYSKMPEPSDIERAVETWAEIGVEFEGVSAPKP